jgi:hypothetical protein
MPKVIHTDVAGIVRNLQKIFKQFPDRATSHARSNATKYNGWQNEEKLLELRKRLIEKVKEACYEKNDAAMVALKTDVVNRSLDPYLEIAVLSLIIGYHVSGQLDKIEAAICS